MSNILSLKYIINESTFDLNQDVDYIFKNCGFSEFLKDYKKGLFPYKQSILKSIDVNFKTIKSTELKSKVAKKASLKNPVDIHCGLYSSGNFYFPAKNKIQVSIGTNALYFMYSDGDISYFPARRQKTIKEEITESRIKTSIYHELSHWIRDTNSNFFITNILKKTSDVSKSDSKKADKIRNLGNSDVNMAHYEIDAYIHGIKQIKRLQKNKWDLLTLDDLFILYPPLGMLNSKFYDNYGRDAAIQWQKSLVRRMARENLLGSRMKNLSLDFSK
jgi:hypothetical protein